MISGTATRSPSCSRGQLGRAQDRGADLARLVLRGDRRPVAGLEVVDEESDLVAAAPDHLGHLDGEGRAAGVDDPTRVCHRARTYRRWCLIERMGRLESAPATGAAPRVVKLASFEDGRGTLIAADGGEVLPFSAVRYFLVRNVPPGSARAQHAQRRGEELLSCPAGSCTVELRWRGGHAVHRLADPETALHLPPWVWGRIPASSPPTLSSSSSAPSPTTRTTSSPISPSSKPGRPGPA